MSNITTSGVVVVLLIGGLCGGLASYILLDSAPEGGSGDVRDPSLGSLRELSTNHRAEQPQPAAGPATVAERLAAYHMAAEFRDTDSVEAALRRAAAEPPSSSRDAQLEAFVARFGELDAARASLLSITLNLDARSIVGVWLIWAEQDGEAALAALDMIEQTDVRHAVAIALLDVLGLSLRAIERVAAVLPPMDRDAFKIAGFVRQAGRDPYDALSEALALSDPSLRRRIVLEVTAVAARANPQAALIQADVLPAELRAAARSTIATEWARLDATGFLRSLSSSGELENLAGGMQILTASDPGALLTAIEGMDGPLVTQLNAMAFAALAELDPRVAMARAEATPPGEARERALQSVASVYARQDAEAALAWAQGLSASPIVMRTVVTAIAAGGDFDRALSLVESGVVRNERDAVLSFIANRVAEVPAEARALADRLVTQNDAHSRVLVERIIESWVRNNPDSAIDWMLGNGMALDAATVGNAARAFANRDVDAAAEYTDRLPAALRSEWLTQVAAAHARTDATAALRWLERYQGQEGYDAALRQLVSEAAHSNPRAAATIFERASADVQLAAAQPVASAWTRLDPEAAAQWAASLNDSRARSSAVAATVATWASRDRQEAERWALSLPFGTVRDTALVTVLPHSARSDANLDDRLLTGFSSTALRDDTLARIIPVMVARNNGVEARRLLNLYVTDLHLRQQLNQFVEGRNAPGIPAFADPREGTPPR